MLTMAITNSKKMNTLSLTHIRWKSVAILINLMRILGLMTTRSSERKFCNNIKSGISIIRFKLTFALARWWCRLQSCHTLCKHRFITLGLIININFFLFNVICWLNVFIWVELLTNITLTKLLRHGRLSLFSFFSAQKTWYLRSLKPIATSNCINLSLI